MLTAQKVNDFVSLLALIITDTFELGENSGTEGCKSKKAVIVQGDNLLMFRHFSKRSADDAINVCHNVLEMKILTDIFHSMITKSRGHWQH
jgi:hypothetical protein